MDEKSSVRIKLLPHSGLVLNNGGESKTSEPQKKRVSVNVLTASDNIPTFSTSPSTLPQKIISQNEAQLQTSTESAAPEAPSEVPNLAESSTRSATPVSFASMPTSSNSENEMDTDILSPTDHGEIPSDSVSHFYYFIRVRRSLKTSQFLYLQFLKKLEAEVTSNIERMRPPKMQIVSLQFLVKLFCLENIKRNLQSLNELSHRLFDCAFVLGNASSINTYNLGYSG